MKCVFVALAICLAFCACQEKQEPKTDKKAREVEPEFKGVTISGIDFAKAESITTIIKGVNMIRGSQDVRLTLDGSRTLSVMDLPMGGHPLFFYAGKDGISEPPYDDFQKNRDEFILRLKTLAKAGKAGGHDKFPLQFNFDDSISGEEGHQILKDLCDNGMILMLRREYTREERALQLKQNLERKLEKKPSSPSDAYKKRAEQDVAPDGE